MRGGSSVKTMRHARPRHRSSSLRVANRNKPRRWLRVLPYVVVLIVLAAAAGAGVQWFRGVPAPTLSWTVPSSVKLAGSTPALPLPASGESVVAVQGLGTIGAKNAQQPVPIASITKVMTAYLVLKDHPLAAGAEGPAIPVTAADVALYKAEAAGGQSTVPVTAGQSLSELDALEGLLVPSANNLADLLARWDAGSDPAFVAKMNAAAQGLGLANTHFADPSGLNPTSMSSASDLLALGQAAMADPIFAQVVAMPQVNLPGGHVVYNYDYDLGHNGIIGIKTGSDSAAGGCFLFESRQQVDGHNVIILGAVLGQQGVSPITTALTAAENMVKGAASALGSFTAVPSGQVFGKVATAWGSSSKVVASSAAQFFGWPGMTVETRLLPGRMRGTLPAGARVGTLELNAAAGQSAGIALDLAGPVNGPSTGWKLTRT